VATDLKGKTALVTGASSGIGAAFARQLAAAGASVIITARRADRLAALAQELEAAHGTVVTTLSIDLAEPGGAAALFAATEGAGKAVDVLVNNAGFGGYDRFDRLPWASSRDQIQLNITSLTELTHGFLGKMLARGGGHILNVASIGAYMPVPHYATYAATKAFVRNFTEAIASELADTPVRVCCLCPGGTKTEFFDAAGHKPNLLVRATMMSADACAEIGLYALFEGRRNIIAGWSNSIGMWLLRFLPRRLITWGAGIVMGRPPALEGQKT
jgi:uncharacterized protein